MSEATRTSTLPAPPDSTGEGRSDRAPRMRSAGPAEEALLRRVLDALLREDFRGLLSATVPAAVPELDGGGWLRLDAGPVELLLPVRPGRFLCDYAVRQGLLARRSNRGTEALRRLDDVLAALRPDGDPEAAAGFDDFAAECREALAAERALPPASRGPALRTGSAGSLAHEARAARLGHPVYPTALARRGLSVADLRAHAPEHAPSFALRWLALPHERVVRPEQLPAWWPTPAAVDLDPALDATHVALPVHPLTARSPALRAALATRGLGGAAVLAAASRVRVSPTLSMRTVAVTADPGTHLKLPLPTATLGALNRRTLSPGSLADGALTQRLLAAVVAREPAFAGRILHADETAFGHAGHEALSFLVRRLPAELTACQVVVVAALPARGRSGRPVLAELADRYRGGDAVGLFRDYADLLLRWHATLWLRYGIALESHQQNVSLVLDPATPGPAGVALLYKDDDGPRIDPTVLAEALGESVAADLTGSYSDPRVSAGPVALADLFTTVTLHLCAGAVAFALADAGVARAAVLLGVVRDAARGALADLADCRDAAVLRDRVLEADRLPVKAMLTAGTLLPKSRTGAADINKFYVRTGPNYLRGLR